MAKKSFALLLLSLASTACVSEATRPAAAPAPVRPPLPVMVSEGDCSPLEAPDPCTWALSTDAVVVGQLVAVRPLESPAVVTRMVGQPARAQRELRTSCEGVVNPGLELELRVERTLHGKLSGTVKVRMGKAQAMLLNPLPQRGAGGQVAWQPMGTGAGSPLVAGQRLGLALHYVPEHGAWSIMGEPLFAPVAEGAGEVVRFQSATADCFEPPPAALEGRTLAEMAQVLASCTSAKASKAPQRHARVWNTWGQNPEQSVAGVCISKPEPLAPGACQASLDCGPGERCVSGGCRQQ